VIEKRKAVVEINKILQNISLEADQINNYLEAIHSTPVIEKQKVIKILLRPDVDILSLINAFPELRTITSKYTQDQLQQAEIQIKYERYIEKEQDLVIRMSGMEELMIPEGFNYDKVSALSNEALQKFK